MKKVANLGHISIAQVYFLEKTSELKFVQEVLHVVPPILLGILRTRTRKFGFNIVNIYCFIQKVEHLFSPSVLVCGCTEYNDYY